MTMSRTQRRFTPEEYLDLEAAAEIKHEYHAGLILEIFACSYWHSRITANVIGEVGRRLKGTACAMLDGKMRVRLVGDDRYVYPDAMVVCGEPRYDPIDSRLTTIVNPKLVVEVVAKSTEAYDRGGKFAAYRDLESLVEYVLVSQDQPQLETYFRLGDGSWQCMVWTTLSAVANLRSLQINIPLSEVYAGVTFPIEDVENIETSP